MRATMAPSANAGRIVLQDLAGSAQLRPDRLD